MIPPDDARAIRARALAAGFHRVGFAAVGPLAEDHPRYLEYLAQGRHGDMDWLAENADVRRDLRGPGILEGARSVIVCALSYHRGAEGSPMPGAAVARYARGGDYHNFFRKKLRRLAAWLRREYGAEARPLVDTAPVLERAWARRAGVGFVGRNGCIIAPGLGSYLLLGEVVTDLALPPDEPMEERCGSCTRCLDACPTQAFLASHVLDARRCVSYLTIEHAGPIDPSLRAGVGDRLFGCDDCQDVCPFNRTAPPPLSSTAGFAPDPRWAEVSPEAILAMEPARWDALAEGTPLARPGWERMARNAAVVLGNTGTRRHLPVLRAQLARDDSPSVEAARAAIEAIVAREDAR
ncbi:MAG: Epoxyqueuosine (oQ) reductase QueG [Myxococcaceae bacterium]|nr:Epoxyqueuosine (oQ) reductase QueG [Myxococcaceae bacterium]